jgi:hypothetical protein
MHMMDGLLLKVGNPLGAHGTRTRIDNLFCGTVSYVCYADVEL